MNQIRFSIIMLLFISATILSMAQEAEVEQAESITKSKGSLPIGFGATFIDGETYYLVNIMPELEFDQFGIGLDINLRFNTKGKLRTGDYEKFKDYLRIIRYVRWAQKGEPFYVRVGQLDYSLLGHGSIIYNYKNSASYDLRKIGLELDVNFDKFGFESVYSDISDAGLVGLRSYIKPLKITGLSKLAVLNNIEIGATIASDLNDKANITRSDSSGKSLTIIGFDLGIPILYYKKLKSILYLDYSKIFNYGHGSALGINVLSTGIAGISLRGKYELRFNSDKYIPSYFNALYELERYNPITHKSKSDSLFKVPANNSYFGELVITILNTFDIIAGYQAPFYTNDEGILHAELKLPEVSGVMIRVGYDKGKIGKVFVFDNYSILSAEIGYKPVPFLMFSTLYQRTFSDRDANGNKLGYFIAQDRVEPKISVIFEF